MGTGLTFDEFVELRLNPRAGADRVFREAAKQEREQMFPMHTTLASHHLRSRGYDCKPTMLELLVERGVVTLAEPDTWTQTDVDAAAEHFEDCEMFVPVLQPLGVPTGRCLLREVTTQQSGCGRRTVRAAACCGDTWVQSML